MGLPSDDGSVRFRLLLTALLVAISVGAATDLYLDLPHDPGAIHIAFEATLMALSLGAVAYLWAGWMRARQSLARVREMSEAHRAERDAWRKRAEKLLRGLGEEIDGQLRRWRLTPARRE